MQGEEGVKVVRGRWGPPPMEGKSSRGESLHCVLLLHWGNLCIARALHAHCTLLLDYVPPEEPPSTPLGNALRIR